MRDLFDAASEAEMRTLYAHLGASPKTTEAAIQMRRRKSELPPEPSPFKGRGRRGRNGKFYYEVKKTG